MQDHYVLPPTTLAAMREAAGGWLTPGRATAIAAAPGRLDVMGGIADYSGAVVLEGTIGDLAVVAVQRRDDDLLRVRTVGPETHRLERREFSLRTSDFCAGGPAGGLAGGGNVLKPYDAVQALFPEEARWAAYVLGVCYVLLAEGELAALPGGADVLLSSTVPLGAGVASSAAVEVAAMRAIVAAYGAGTSGLRLAALCQLVENRVVGAPCGIMDQVTCALGQAGALLALRCQPHDVLGWHAPPAGYGFAGLDSGVKHTVGGRRYGRVRCAAFMGRRIIGEHLAAAGGDRERAAYLCNLTPDEYRTRFRHLLPTRLSGREFLECWGDTGDSATTIDPAQTYAVRGATEHPIYENDRVLRFMAKLQQAGAAVQAGDRKQAQRAIRAAGRLMYGSHRSYSRNCGLGSKETDLLVSLVRQAGPDAGLFGAKITGGGSGGTVAVLLET
ncbi:MAG: galactokinase, partial [Chloroflexota bacterium]